MSRSEDQIVAQMLTLTFAGNDYEVKILTIKESREWRKKLANKMGEAASAFNVNTDNPEEYKEGLDILFIDMPDAITELVFDYGKSLPKDEIEAVATDAEMAKAFESILEVAFPLARSVTGITAKLSR